MLCIYDGSCIIMDRKGSSHAAHAVAQMVTLVPNLLDSHPHIIQLSAEMPP